MSDYIIRAVNIRKSFDGVKALQGVTLEIKKGEIHCLAGENGCGKSTLIKIISGVYTCDDGIIEFNGEKQDKILPLVAIKNGIQVIYQDFSIFPNLSVIENIAYNSELMNNRKLVNWKRFREIAQAAIDTINFKVDLDAKVGDLSVAEKQLVAISRALINNAKLIIMDEPTTALTKKEVEALFKIIKELQSQGISILFVSHKLDEVFEISERYTILRNGQNVSSGDTSELDDEKFTYYMTGRKFEDEYFSVEVTDDEPVLELKDLTVNGQYKDVSFKLHKGEILGVTGLLGSGRTELALTLFGMNKPDSGQVLKNGQPIELKSIREAIKNKIGYVPEDRLTEGLFLVQSISRNIVISKIKSYANKIGLLNTKASKQESVDLVKKLRVKAADAEHAVSTLSGGNQQKVVLAKWLATDLDILILNGPTVGVDIGSKHDIHAILQDLARQGLSIIIISDDVPEVLMNCNRIVIMQGGRITAEVNPQVTTDKELAALITTTKEGGSAL